MLMRSDINVIISLVQQVFLSVCIQSNIIAIKNLPYNIMSGIAAYQDLAGPDQVWSPFNRGD